MTRIRPLLIKAKGYGTRQRVDVYGSYKQLSNVEEKTADVTVTDYCTVQLQLVDVPQQTWYHSQLQSPIIAQCSCNGDFRKLLHCAIIRVTSLRSWLDLRHWQMCEAQIVTPGCLPVPDSCFSAAFRARGIELVVTWNKV